MHLSIYKYRPIISSLLSFHFAQGCLAHQAYPRPPRCQVLLCSVMSVVAKSGDVAGTEVGIGGGWSTEKMEQEMGESNTSHDTKKLCWMGWFLELFLFELQPWTSCFATFRVAPEIPTFGRQAFLLTDCPIITAHFNCCLDACHVAGVTLAFLLVKTGNFFQLK